MCHGCVTHAVPQLIPPLEVCQNITKDYFSDFWKMTITLFKEKKGHCWLLTTRGEEMVSSIFHGNVEIEWSELKVSYIS